MRPKEKSKRRTSCWRRSTTQITTNPVKRKSNSRRSRMHMRHWETRRNDMSTICRLRGLLMTKNPIRVRGSGLTDGLKSRRTMSHFTMFTERQISRKGTTSLRNADTREKKRRIGLISSSSSQASSTSILSTSSHKP